MELCACTLVLGTTKMVENIDIVAGATLAKAKTGGNVSIAAGEGSNKYQFDGGNGGKLSLTGGAAKGRWMKDDDRNVLIAGRYAKHAIGGSIILNSGSSFETSSGSIAIFTPNSGVAGVSGSIELATGFSNKGDSGYINFQSGNAKEGKGGYIELKVGTGNKQNGGDMKMHSGSTTGRPNKHYWHKKIDTYGGSIEMNSGFLENTSSGSTELCTANAGHKGVSGNIQLKSGNTKDGEAGFITMNSGNATSGFGGHIELLAGRGDAPQGADLVLHCGEAIAKKTTGGRVRIFGGHGTSEDRYDGGNGGKMELLQNLMISVAMLVLVEMF